MPERKWDDLNEVEKAIVVNAFEIETLAGIVADLDYADEATLRDDAARQVLKWVDDGIVEVRRWAPWTAPNGTPDVHADQRAAASRSLTTRLARRHNATVPGITIKRVALPAGVRTCTRQPNARKPNELAEHRPYVGDQYASLAHAFDQHGRREVVDDGERAQVVGAD